MIRNQISVFIENRRGSLADITGILAEKNINILALHISETNDYGILRLIVDDVDKAVAVLSINNHIARQSSVLEVEVPDCPGGLHKLLKHFNEKNIEIEYMYSIFNENNGKAHLIIKVDDCEKAEDVVVRFS